MDATLILIDSDAELLRARALVDQLWNSNDPADVARLDAQGAAARVALSGRCRRSSMMIRPSARELNVHALDGWQRPPRPMPSQPG